MKTLRLGIIGLSDGNGHPYSWSAIFNGYNQTYMQSCPFPVIPQYLAKQKFPDDCIKGAKVTHIWTQDPKISAHIAKASNIPTIVKNYDELIGQVDAVLLARDDAENHSVMSEPFLSAGLPIYIDKPLSLSVRDAKIIYKQQQYEGQLFTCSAISYGKEFSDMTDVGKVLYVDAVIAKSWKKYAIHIVETVLRMFHDRCKEILSVTSIHANQVYTVNVQWTNELITSFTTLGDVENIPIMIKIYGDKGCQEIVFQDTFYAFKSALLNFINIVRKKDPVQSKEFVLKTIDIVEKGLMHV